MQRLYVSKSKWKDMSIRNVPHRTAPYRTVAYRSVPYQYQYRSVPTDITVYL